LTNTEPIFKKIKKIALKKFDRTVNWDCGGDSHVMTPQLPTSSSPVEEENREEKRARARYE